MALLNIVGGVALILFGIRFLRKGLERLFGQQLYDWIERTARRPWQAAVAGLAFGTVAPSSTAQTLVALQLLRAGRLSPEVRKRLAEMAVHDKSEEVRQAASKIVPPMTEKTVALPPLPGSPALNPKAN